MSLVSIYTGGILTLLMALFHTRFYKMFNWEAEYNHISKANTRIFYTIHLALLILFFFLGSLSLIYAPELSRCSGIAFGINVMFAAFWFWRALWQIFYFKGRGRILNYVLIAVFFVLGISYLIPVFLKLSQ
jgi:hypothetical protein